MFDRDGSAVDDSANESQSEHPTPRTRRALIDAVASRVALGFFIVLGLYILAVPVKLYFVIAQMKAEAVQADANMGAIERSGSAQAESHDVVIYYTSPSAAQNDSSKCGKYPSDNGMDCYAARVGVYANTHRARVASLVRELRKSSAPALKDALTACFEKADYADLHRGELPMNEACVAAFVATSYRIAFQV